MRKSAPLFCALLLSLSARRAWIEIALHVNGGGLLSVALRKESVDRNRLFWFNLGARVSSLSARRAWIEMRAGWLEIVYRRGSLSARRAWIEITWVQEFPKLYQASLSARRAWIEIVNNLSMLCSAGVALRKESVDRNCPESLFICLVTVALRKESVDRNSTALASMRVSITSLSARRAWIEIRCAGILRLWACCRSPQGERG